MLRLVEYPGWGSALVEVQIAFYGLPCELVHAGEIFADPAARERLRQLNPLVQIPTLVLDDGQVMTESAAMTLYLADLAGSTALVPGPGDPERPAFLRWLIFLVAAVYPTFTYGDVPTRFVPEDQAPAFKARVDAERMAHWRLMEDEARQRGGPWFLGRRMTAIDVFLMVMVHWEPGRDWFARQTPSLFANAAAAAALPVFAEPMARNFP